MHSHHARTRPATHLSPQPPITHSPTLTLRTGYAHVLVPPLPLTLTDQDRLRAAEEAAFTPPDLEMSRQRMEEYQLD